jgi:protein XagA
VLKCRVWVGISLGFFASPSIAMAGAWTLPEGSGQAIVTAAGSVANRAFSGSGLAPISRYSKFEVQGLLEYGLTNKFTFIFAPSLESIDIGAPISARRTGLGYTEIGGRYLLAQSDSWVLSGQATVRIPGVSDTSNPAAIGYTAVETDVRALIGHSFSIGGMPAFVDMQFAQRFSGPGSPSEFRADLSLGVRTSERWLLLAQSFNVVSEGSAGWIYSSYEYYKFQLSGIYSITPSWAVQVGAFTTYAGRNALQENGGIVGVWHKF